MITFDTIKKLESATLKQGDLVQVLGEFTEGDVALITGKVYPSTHTSSNRLVTIANGLVVEIFPTPLGDKDVTKKYVNNQDDKIRLNVREDSASQLGLVYFADWKEGLVVPMEAMKNKLAVWHNGQFYSVSTDAGFTTGAVFNSDNWVLSGLMTSTKTNAAISESQIEEWKKIGDMRGWGVDPSKDDNAIEIQQCFDDCFNMKIVPKAPSGRIRTSKTLTIWCQNYDLKQQSGLVGRGVENTVFVKTTNTKSDVVNHTDIDAIFIVANVYSKEGNVITATADTAQVACYGLTLGGFSCDYDLPLGNLVFYSIYSLGWFRADIHDINITRTFYGMYTEYYNVISDYKRIDMNLVYHGFSFRGKTLFIGNTTMTFESCHMNGVKAVCYDLLGSALMIKCSFDAGDGIHIRCEGIDRGLAGNQHIYNRGHVTMIGCHHESPSMLAANSMFDLTYSDITTYNPSIEIPTTYFTDESSVIKLRKYSSYTQYGGAMGYRLNVPITRGALYDKDQLSDIAFNSSIVNPALFGNIKQITTDSSYGKVIFDAYHHDISDCRKIISYVPGNVPVSEYTTTSTTDRGYVDIVCTQNNGHVISNVIQFPRMFDLTNLSTLAIEGDVIFKEGNNTAAVNYQIVLSKTLFDDGYVSVGSSIAWDHVLTPEGQVLSTQSFNGYQKRADITGVSGKYYIGVLLYGENITCKITNMILTRGGVGITVPPIIKDNLLKKQDV